jgi:hypothetical protein
MTCDIVNHEVDPYQTIGTWAVRIEAGPSFKHTQLLSLPLHVPENTNEKSTITVSWLCIVDVPCARGKLLCASMYHRTLIQLVAIRVDSLLCFILFLSNRLHVQHEACLSIKHSNCLP